MYTTSARSDMVGKWYQHRAVCNSFGVWKYDNLWTLEHDTRDLYIALTPRRLPPSSGWEAVDDARYPAPSVVLHRLDQIETIRNYHDPRQRRHDDADASAAPVDWLDFRFKIGDGGDEAKQSESESTPIPLSPVNGNQSERNRRRGFPQTSDADATALWRALGVALALQDKTGLIVVAQVAQSSQASALGVMVGDIVCGIEDEDVSLMGSVEKLTAQLLSAFAATASSVLTLKFARNKKTFPVVMVQRSDSREVDDKYSVAERLRTGAWRLLHKAKAGCIRYRHEHLCAYRGQAHATFVVGLWSVAR